MKAFFLSLVVAGAALALACGPGAPKSGVVVQKWYEEERRWETSETYCMVHDGKGYCTVWGTRDVKHYDDPDWMVRLEECHYDDNGNRKCRQGNREIPQGEWEQLKVGDSYGEAR